MQVSPAKINIAIAKPGQSVWPKGRFGKTDLQTHEIGNLVDVLNSKFYPNDLKIWSPDNQGRWHDKNALLTDLAQINAQIWFVLPSPAKLFERAWADFWAYLHNQCPNSLVVLLNNDPRLLPPCPANFNFARLFMSTQSRNLLQFYDRLTPEWRSNLRLRKIHFMPWELLAAQPYHEPQHKLQGVSYSAMHAAMHGAWRKQRLKQLIAELDVELWANAAIDDLHPVGQVACSTLVEGPGRTRMQLVVGEREYCSLQLLPNRIVESLCMGQLPLIDRLLLPTLTGITQIDNAYDAMITAKKINSMQPEEFAAIWFHSAAYLAEALWPNSRIDFSQPATCINYMAEALDAMVTTLMNQYKQAAI